jgi:NitT/TauT family transport system substrate-binding protein
MSMIRRLLAWGLLFAVVACALMPMDEASAQRQKITFAMGWSPSDHHTPYFVAIDKGYYAQQGLDVEIQFSKGSGDAAAKVDTGRVEFANPEASAVLAAVARGGQIKIVGMVFNRTPLNIFVWNDSPIKTPKDLEGKTLGGPPADIHRLMFPAFAKLHGFEATKVEWVNIDPLAKIGALTAKRVDAVGDYTTFLPLYEKGMGAGNVRGMPYGLDLYSVSIIARNDTIAKQPDLIRKFLQATYEGWRDSIKDPEGAVAIFKRHVPELDTDLVRRQFGLTIKLVESKQYAEHGMGWIDPERMCTTVRLVNEYMGLPRKLECGEIYTSAAWPSVALAK